MTRPVGLRREIGEQPEVAARLLAEGRADVERLVATLRERGRPSFVLVAARGTSDHAATYAKYALGHVARLPVALAAPSLLTRYGAGPQLRDGLVLGISQSGRSPDVVAVVADARRQGQVTAALTNDPASPLAAAADHVLPLRAGEEASVAATKTYGAELLAVAMLAAALAEGDEHREQLELVPEAIRRALELEDDAVSAAGSHRSMQEAVILGRGFNLATALEWALKLKELAYVRAQGYSTADFQHGPSASLAPGGHLLAVSTGGPLDDELTGVLDEMASSRRAHVLRLAGDADAAADGVLRFPRMLPEWLSPLAAMVPMQLFCYHLARAKGLDFESPRGLRKVTLTH
jgi:glucosamine--fructose-6-phosphate aminotransferase (isomerizing)